MPLLDEFGDELFLGGAQLLDVRLFSTDLQDDERLSGPVGGEVHVIHAGDHQDVLQLGTVVIRRPFRLLRPFVALLATLDLIDDFIVVRYAVQTGSKKRKLSVLDNRGPQARLVVFLQLAASFRL